MNVGPNSMSQVKSRQGKT